MTCSEFFEKIAVQYDKKRPFVAYWKPGEGTIKAVFQMDDRVNLLKNFSESGFVFAPFNSESENILLKPDELLECSGSSKGDFDVVDNGRSSQSTVEEHNRSEKLDSEIFDSSKKTLYLNFIAEAIGEIEKGTFQKVVLSRRIDVTSKTPPLVLFKRLLSQYPNAFCYFWYHPKIGIWLGATPESLLQLNHRQLTTMSLAGTQKYKGLENPQWGQKELEEQELVTDYILGALRDKVSDLRRSPTETILAGDLLHLRTKITGFLKQGGAGQVSSDIQITDISSSDFEKDNSANLDTIIRALHPTPAVCGLPKETALDFIIKNEKYDREFYTGFLGELNMSSKKQRNQNRKNQETQAYRSIAKSTTLFVNLRCMKLTDEIAYIYVGGGITKDSDPEREWEETVAKSKTMLSILD